jgi:PBP1b-binding outer membrane lipoprotein LpoB
MNHRIAVCAVLFIVIAALAAGCMQPAPTQQTPAPEATAPTAGPAAATTVATVEPFGTVPSAQQVEFTLIKDRVYGTITLTFVGGPGQVVLQKVWMKVSRSDGQVITDTMVFRNRNQVSKGDTLEMEGTRGVDRAEVFVTLSGTDYKVMDRTLGGQEFYK